MADAKTTALSANTTPADADVIPIVDDPGGTPASQKMTLATLKTFVQASLGSRGTSQSTTANSASSTQGVTVTAHATPHTKGTPVELIASTAFAAETVDITVNGVGLSNTNTAMLLDIVTGASLDVVLIPNVMLGYTYASGVSYYRFHIAIPAGTRVGAQIQAATTADTADNLSIRLHQGGGNASAGTSVTACGVETTTSSGAVLTTAGSVNTKSVWSTVIASTAAAFRWIVVGLSPNSSAGADGTGLVDIGVGAVSSEVVIVPDFFYGTTSTETMRYQTMNVHTVSIPAGSRIAARYQSTSTAAGAKPNVVVYGIT